MSDKYPDTHRAVHHDPTTAMIVITVPATGWYRVAGECKSIYLTAGTQFIMNEPLLRHDPKTLTIRNDR